MMVWAQVKAQNTIAAKSLLDAQYGRGNVIGVPTSLLSAQWHETVQGKFDQLCKIGVKGATSVISYNQVVSEQFKQLDSEELLEKINAGALTEVADEIAREELRNRGVSLDAATNPSDFHHLNATNPTVSKQVATVRPWIRYWARWFDFLIIGLPCYFFFAGVFVVAGLRPSLYLVVYLGLCLGLFIESACISAVGTTPGKWLLGVRVRHELQQKITIIEAMQRSLRVWWRGLGAFLPIVYLFTELNAYKKLKGTGITSWDKDGKFVVVHLPIRVYRVVVAIIILLVLFAARK